jgi:phospholipid/cholesterol/gamma-HCH transport system substrate-binding protein
MSHVFRLGLFVVATLLLFAGGVFLIGSKQMYFRQSYHLKASFANVAGLAGGADVRIGGFRQGSVTRIDLPRQPDQGVTVTMDLAKATHEVIRKDSIASIASEGLVGDKYVEITFGSKDAGEVKDGDAIQGVPPVQMADLLKKADGILDSASSAVNGIGASAENLKDISGKINSGQGTVGALINDKTIYKAAAAGANEFQEDMEALKHNFLLRGFFHKRGYQDSASLKQNEIPDLPAAMYDRRFVYDSAKIFDKPDTAKLKHEQALNDAGHFLEQDKFGLAVVLAHTGMKGDTQKSRELTEAQSMVVRDYLAKNFKFDDTHLKTLGLGKDPDTDASQVEILVYPVTEPAKETKKTTPPR